VLRRVDSVSYVARGATSTASPAVAVRVDPRYSGSRHLSLIRLNEMNTADSDTAG